MEISSRLNMKIIKKIASQGANSTLYLVEDSQLNERFILKKIDKNKIKESNKYFDEVRKLQKIKCQNIVKLNYATYDDENIYISMPYYQNGSLEEIVNDKNLTVREIVAYSLDILTALYYIHEKNILHCDIKPSNILIDKNNKAVLTDFGSATYINSSGTGKLKNVYYKHIAPEQCLSSKVNIYVDIYQFGNTLYRLCNGEVEYNRQVKKYKNLSELKMAISKGDFPIRKKYYPHIPKKLVDIVERCIEKDAQNRYENVLDILNDISQIDENLDWLYEDTKNSHRWILDNKIISMYKSNNRWIVKCYFDDVFENSFEKISEGFKYIRRLIKENN